MIGNFKISTNNRLALLVNHIMDRIQRADQTSIANQCANMKNTTKRAQEKVQRFPKHLDRYTNNNCNCSRSQYYSTLYGVSIPCIHQILNDKWQEKDIMKMRRNHLILLKIFFYKNQNFMMIQ
ncbi:hypothetical protein M9Y10_011625 [Tritrichomonas musculus]|uniref:Uncharacterized protein n=1 Tax=Tritrichomonas musculus TaxID=1915356 RepID=A0ABR2IJY2_9EUKA